MTTSLLTPPEVAELSRSALVTVYRALADGSLHGSQRCKGGKWRVRPECVEAWVDGVPCEHRTNVRTLDRRGRAS